MSRAVHLTAHECRVLDPRAWPPRSVSVLSGAHWWFHYCAASKKKEPPALTTDPAQATCAVCLRKFAENDGGLREPDPGGFGRAAFGAFLPWDQAVRRVTIACCIYHGAQDPRSPSERLADERRERAERVRSFGRRFAYSFLLTGTEDLEREMAELGAMERALLEPYRAELADVAARGRDLSARVRALYEQMLDTADRAQAGGLVAVAGGRA